MAEAEANSWNSRVANVVRRSHGDDTPVDSIHVIEIKDLLKNRMSLKSSAPG